MSREKCHASPTPHSLTLTLTLALSRTFYLLVSIFRCSPVPYTEEEKRERVIRPWSNILKVRSRLGADTTTILSLLLVTTLPTSLSNYGGCPCIIRSSHSISFFIVWRLFVTIRRYSVVGTRKIVDCFQFVVCSRASAVTKIAEFS